MQGDICELISIKGMHGMELIGLRGACGSSVKYAIDTMLLGWKGINPLPWEGHEWLKPAPVYFIGNGLIKHGSNL